MIKRHVVELDEKESGLRKILNFGHTLGHGIESAEELSGLYHGECVALGMLPMCAPDVRERIYSLLSALSLPVSYEYDLDAALSFISSDKKCEGESISVVLCNEIGSCDVRKMTLSELYSHIKSNI